LQTYTADTITFKSSKQDFLIPSKSPWASHTNLWDLYQQAHTPWDWHGKIFERAASLGLGYFSSPFDETAVDFLMELDVSAMKIASPEITHIPLLKKVAKTGLPVIVSTGLANQDDIDLAVSTIRAEGGMELALLQCASAYPAPLSECNLNTMKDMASRYQAVVGFSDHTLGATAAMTAVACGAKIIEKHIDLNDPETETVDSFFSANADEFKRYVEFIREVELCLGTVDYEISETSSIGLNGRRSLYVVKNLEPGDVLGVDNIRCIRPTYGLHPMYFDKLLGRKVVTSLQAGDRLTMDAVQWE
jgi:pseudaminic acid synthase